MNRKRVYLSVTDKQYELIKTKASEVHLPITSYLLQLFLKNMDDTSLATIDNQVPNVSTGKSTYRFSKEDTTVLKNKAAASGLTPNAYLRYLIHTKDFCFVSIYTDDIEKYISELSKLFHSVSSFISLIYRNGSFSVYESDIKNIKNDISEIKALMQLQVKLTISNRDRAYRKMVNLKPKKKG